MIDAYCTHSNVENSRDAAPNITKLINNVEESFIIIIIIIIRLFANKRHKSNMK